MERFNSFIKDQGFYMSNGEVVLSKAIGEKTLRTKRIKKGIFEGFDTTGFKQAIAEKLVDHNHHEPRNDLHDNKKRTHIDDVQMNKNIYGETGHELTASHRGHDIEEVGSLSSKLEQKMTPAQHKAFRHFTNGKSDTIDDGKKWASSHIAKHFISNHKLKADNKKLAPYRAQYPYRASNVIGQDKNAADHLKTAAKPLGHEVHLYSGVHPSFVQAIKHAKKHTDGVVHSPAHISTTHDVHTAAGFAIHSGHENQHVRPLNKNTDTQYVGKTTKHMIHVHAKASDKGIHMSGVEGNKHAAEAETVLPPATRLKYSHTTHHYHTMPDQGDDDHHRIDVHHCTIHKQD